MRAEWINRLRYLGRRSQFEDDLTEEIRFHLETRASELEQSGIPRAEALAQARREFGPIARMGEDSRAAWQFRWLEDLAADLRYALRAFCRSPGFTLTAVISLALGIGANTGIFTALYAVLWKPLPIADPARIVALSMVSPSHSRGQDLPLAFIRTLRESGIFADLSVLSADGLSFFYGERAERIMGEVVSPGYFEMLGVRPILGQPFSPEVRAGRWAAEAVLSYSFWKSRFAGDPSVIGRTILLNTYPFTVAGISPPGFFGLGRGTDYELRIPVLPYGRELSQIALINANPDGGRSAVALLKPGTTAAQVEAAAEAKLQQFLRTTPISRFRSAEERHLRLVPAGYGDNGMLQQFHAPLYVLLALVGVVLMIACANLASMLMARATARARELAVRTSLGAGRLRLVRQMLAESLLLSLLGGALAVAVGKWAADLLVRFLPQGHIRFALDLGLDRNALLFTLTLSLVTSVLFGLAPALYATRGNLTGALKSDSSGSIGALRGAAFRKALVVAQVAFSLALLIGAGVFIKTMFDLRPSDYRVNPDRVLLFTMKPQREIYSPLERRALVATLVHRVPQIPGVAAAGVAEYGPLGSRTSEDSVEAERNHPVRADTDWVTPGFFDAAGIRRIAGRDFTAADRVGSPFVVNINQSLARALFGNENPIGRSLRFTKDKDARPFEIVGVVADAHYYNVHESPRPGVWFAFQDYAAPYMPTLHVRTSQPDTAAMIAAVRREFDAFDKGFPVFNIKTLEMRIDDSLATERMVANLSGAFGVLALALAAVGLYGVLAYSVSRRTREIGIRMALGSTARATVWMVAREATLLVVMGSVAGAAIAAVAIRLLARQLPGLSQIDAPVLIASSTMMLAIAILAVSIPAMRACRIDPLTALHHD